jgi:hypothetical protein
MKSYRQGDILFVECEEIPAAARQRKDGIVARGEVTGHTHRLAGGTAMLMICAGIAYINAQTEAYVRHDEHKEIILPPGKYRIKRQREYTPNGWRQVTD